MIRRAAAVVLACAALPAASEPVLRGPVLGAASNFAQNWQPEALNGAAALGITMFRDEVIWGNVEQADGRLRFGSMREAYPEMLTARGAGMLLLAYDGHPRWSDDNAPVTDEGMAAFARYYARIVERFPLIHSVEIGNEYNSWEFAENDGWPADFSERADLYVRQLAMVRAEVGAVDPEVRILGGAAHSIPLAWISAVLEAGGAAHMDAFVLHPYTTRPEQLRRQIALARALPGFGDMPIEVTEFGTPDAEAAPGYLMRMYCQMALSGVTGATWYPFSPRGDGLEPLLLQDGTPTETGRTHAFIRAHLEGLPVADVAPDPFTYACRFGDRALVIWGAPRSVSLAPGLRAHAPAGGLADDALMLSRDTPLVILSDGPPVSLGDTVRLGPQTVRADSFDQFAYGDGAGPLTLFVRRQHEELPLSVRPGQERDGVPWTPYLSLDADGSVRVGADWASDSSWGPEDPLKIVWRYRAATPEVVDVTVTATPDATSEDGVTVEIARNGAIHAQEILKDRTQVAARRIALAPGDVIEAALGPNRTAWGDHTRIRVRVEVSQ